jgi:hypothetical protein
MTLRLIIWAAVLALVTLAVPAMAQTGSEPIPGIDIIVKKRPGGTAMRLGATDARGQVSFEAEAGAHGLLLPAVQAAREAARRSAGASPPPGGVVARVEVGRAVVTSAPLMLTGEGRAEFQGTDGRPLTISIPRGGARVRVTLVPCCWAADPGRSTGAAAVVPPRQAAGATIGGTDVGLDGVGGRVRSQTGGDPDRQVIGGTPIQGTPIILDGEPINRAEPQVGSGPVGQGINGNPVGGIDVGLDGIPPGRIMVRTTDARGQVNFEAEAGGMGLLLPSVQAVREAARRSGTRPPDGVVARVEVGGAVLTSAPLMLTGEGRAEFRGTDGRPMVIPIPRGGARVRVTLTVWDDTDIVH